MSNDKSEASDVKMEDLCSNSNPKGHINNFNMNNIKEINSNISIKEEDNILKDTMELVKKNIPNKEEIDILLDELAKIDNNLNLSNDIIEPLDIEELQVHLFIHKTSGSNRR